MKAPGRIKKGTASFVRGVRLVYKSSPRLSILTSLVMVFQGVLPLVPLYAVKRIVDAVSGETGFQDLLPVIILAGGALILSALFSTSGAFLRQTQAQVLSDYMQGVIQKKSAELDLSYYEMPEFQDKLHRAQQEAPYRPAEIVDIVTGLIRSGISAAGIAGLLLFTLPWFTVLLLIVSAIPAGLVLLSASARMYTWRMQQTSAERHVYYLNWLLTAKSNIMENRILGLDNLFRGRAKEWRDRLRGELLSLTGRRSVYEFLAVSFQSLITIGLIGYFSYTSIQGKGSLGNLVLFFQAIQRGQQTMSELLRGAARLYETNLYLSTVFEFLNLPARMVPAESEVPSGEQKAEAGLTVDSVSFAYPGTDTPVLDNVSLSVRPGEIVAIVGDNGAGKSTLIKLVCRFYDPVSGQLRLNGRELHDIPEHEYRTGLGVLFQDFTRYFYSVRENIWFGDVDKNPDGEGVRNAARKVEADGFLSALTDGYETVLGRWLEDGTELSGGQWKKVALARTIFRAAPLTILDEPTAGLDPPSEALFIDNLRDLAGGRSLLLVSHKIAAARQADRIYVMRSGRVIEQGNHEQLLEQGGYYSGLYYTQLRQMERKSGK